MIGFVRGKLMAVELDSALVETGGVGYEILCSAQVMADLAGSVGTEIALWIHTHVREDALQLFGFMSKTEKELFLSLLKVNGVGPKSALTILSAGRVEKIIEMIEDGNAKALAALPRVGKKTSEQIILSLQGKLVRADAPKGKAAGKSDIQKQIQTALL